MSTSIQMLAVLQQLAYMFIESRWQGKDLPFKEWCEEQSKQTGFQVSFVFDASIWPPLENNYEKVVHFYVKHQGFTSRTIVDLEMPLFVLVQQPLFNPAWRA